MGIFKSILNFFFEVNKTEEHKVANDEQQVPKSNSLENSDSWNQATNSTVFELKQDNIEKTEAENSFPRQSIIPDSKYKETQKISRSLFDEQQKTTTENRNNRTLFSGPRTRKTIYIWVGIDFGTSSTKVAYKVLGTAGREVKPLPLSPKPFEEFEIPSVVAFDKNGDLLLGIEAERELKKSLWKTGIRYLKVLLAGKYDNAFYDEAIVGNFINYVRDNNKANIPVSEENITAVFLAYVMKNSRNKLKRLFTGMDLELNFNICLPIDTYENKAVYNAFEKTIHAAYYLEREWSERQSPTEVMRKAEVTWKQVGELSKGSSRVHLIPEAVAQTASYVTSLSSIEAKHAVIDFGAGTTDFSIFNLVKDQTVGIDTYWYSARTFPGGMQQIESLIGNYFFRQGRKLTHMGVIDCLENFQNQDQDLKIQIADRLQKTWEQARYTVWGKAYGKCMSEREWRGEKVKIFICGGGSYLPPVKDIFCECWHCREWGPYTVDFLERPDNFAGSNSAFRRLAVGYGLSYPEKELGKFTLPEDCPDQTPVLETIPNAFDEHGDPVYFDTR